MKARPILFQPDMVRALLEGRKTQTRRILKQPKRKDGPKLLPELLQKIGVGAACPYGQPGDLLWVRETFYRGEHAIFYAADTDTSIIKAAGARLRPSIHMPRLASRLTLELTDVRVERLCSISEADAIAEGIQQLPGMEYGFLNYMHTGTGTAYYINREGKTEGAAHSSYISLWESINGELEDQIGPWVWVLAFKVHYLNVDILLNRYAA